MANTEQSIPQVGDTVVVPPIVDAVGCAHDETALVTGIADDGAVTACRNDGPFAGAEFTVSAGSTRWVVV